ncbi:LamG domain-containing protein [Candidatus Nanohalovita haloferacivicina]|uniref:LamG domain-containing protein n=1 Tax=Candidatus Nanohalovita haloferacivicina TaxID=2978046 RepID=UPI00325FCA08|nr:LamG domain-containing protein [Candidatus Nanohalobia archaeon BNXNv]
MHSLNIITPYDARILIAAVTLIVAFSAGFDTLQKQNSFSASLSDENRSGLSASSNPLSQTASSSALKEGLEAYYRFDTLDISSGNSIEFDGTDDYIEANVEEYPSDDCRNNCNNPVTISVWIKPTQEIQESAIAGRMDKGTNHWNGWGSGIKYVDGEVRAFSRNDYGDTNPPPLNHTLSNPTEWHHIIAVLRTDNGKLFVDGKLVEQGNLNSGYSYEFGIGAQVNEGNSKNFQGQIQNIKIYNRSITQKEAKTLFSDKPAPRENLVLSYLFKGPQSCDLTSNNSCITDDSGRGNAGTPRNFDDNSFNTGSGWNSKGPVERLKFENHVKGYEQSLIFNNREGLISGGFFEGWEDNNSDGWQTNCGGEPSSRIVEEGYKSDYSYLMNSTGGDGLACAKMSDFDYDAVQGTEIQYACRGYGCKLIVYNGSTSISSGPGTSQHEFHSEWKTYTTTIDKTEADTNIYFYNDDTVGHWVQIDDITEGPIPSEGKYGNSYDFDGANDYVAVPDLIDKDNFSISLWFKPEKSDWESTLYDMSSSSKYFYIEGTQSNITWGREASCDNDLRVTVDHSFTPGEWYQVSVTGAYNTSMPDTVYVNGEKKATEVAYNGGGVMCEKPNYGEPHIGAITDTYGGVNTNFTGKIDDVRFYSKTLSASEEQRLYRGEQVTDGLTAQWSFDSGELGKVYDTATAGKEGILDSKGVNFGEAYNKIQTYGADYSKNYSISAWIKPETERPTSILSQSSYNSLSYSQNTSKSSYWNGYCGWGETNNGFTAPDGSNTAQSIKVSYGTGCDSKTGRIQHLDTEIGKTYTASVWAKSRTGGDDFRLGLDDGNMCLFNLKTYWQYYSCTLEAVQEDRGYQFFNRKDNSTYFVWGAQRTPGKYAGPYTKTEASPEKTEGLNIWTEDGKLIYRYRTANKTVTAHVDAPLTRWTHFTATRKAGQNIKLHRNGEMQHKELISQKAADTLPPILGGTLEENITVFQGGIDELRIYNRSLTELEVEGLSFS